MPGTLPAAPRHLTAGRTPIRRNPENRIGCDICGQECLFFSRGQYRRTGLHSYDFALYKCRDCDCLTVYPRPTNIEYPPTRSEDGNFVPNDIYASSPVPPWNRKIVRELTSHFPDGGELLDFGANSGKLLALAELAGFRCVGVEIDSVAAREGARLGRNVVQGDVLRMDFDTKFDAVVMNHVLEHIPEIREVAPTLNKIIAPGGIVLFNIPYFKGWLPRLMKDSWQQWVPNTHIWFLSKTTIHKLFDPYFEVSCSARTTCEPLGWEWNVKVWAKLLIAKTAELLGRGDELHVILRKRA